MIASEPFENTGTEWISVEENTILFVEEDDVAIEQLFDETGKFRTATQPVKARYGTF